MDEPISINTSTWLEILLEQINCLPLHRYLEVELKTFTFKLLSQALLLKFACDPNIKMCATAIERYFIRYKR